MQPSRRPPICCEQEAVTPVVAVMLMLAVTVTLATVVYAVVSNTAKSAPDTPMVTFSKDSTGQLVRVISADAADWIDVQVDFPADCSVSLQHGGVLEILSSGGRASGTSSVIKGGDTLFVEAPDGTACTVALTHVPSNSSIGSWTFQF